LVIGGQSANFSGGFQVANITHPLGELLKIGVKDQIFGLKFPVIATAGVKQVVFIWFRIRVHGSSPWRREKR
jgi:hypothetical protein